MSYCFSRLRSRRPTLSSIEEDISAKLPDPSTKSPAHTIAAPTPSRLDWLATAANRTDSARNPKSRPRPNRAVRYQRPTTLTTSFVELLRDAPRTSKPTMSKPIGMMVAITFAPSAVIMPRTLSAAAR